MFRILNRHINEETCNEVLCVNRHSPRPLEVDESATGQKANDLFQGKFMDAKRRIEAKQEEIKGLQMELEVQGDMLNELARDEKMRTVERKMKDYQRLVQDSDEELKRQQQEMTLKFFEELQAVLQQIGTDGGYTIIMEKSTVMFTMTTSTSPMSSSAGSMRPRVKRRASNLSPKDRPR